MTARRIAVLVRLLGVVGVLASGCSGGITSSTRLVDTDKVVAESATIKPVLKVGGELSGLCAVRGTLLNRGSSLLIADVWFDAFNATGAIVATANANEVLDPGKRKEYLALVLGNYSETCTEITRVAVRSVQACEAIRTENFVVQCA